MRFAVTGGRDFADWDAIVHALRQIPETATLVHGAARGADSLAAKFWNGIHGRPTEPHPADWSKYRKAAGHIRNQEMINSGIDLLIAFPGGVGTADMVRRAKVAGISVTEIEE